MHVYCGYEPHPLLLHYEGKMVACFCLPLLSDNPEKGLTPITGGIATAVALVRSWCRKIHMLIWATPCDLCYPYDYCIQQAGLDTISSEIESLQLLVQTAARAATEPGIVLTHPQHMSVLRSSRPSAKMIRGVCLCTQCKWCHLSMTIEYLAHVFCQTLPFTEGIQCQ